jgi:hypothetical protein
VRPPTLPQPSVLRPSSWSAAGQPKRGFQRQASARETAQLVNAVKALDLWAEKTYDREGIDNFAIQSDLALRTVGALERVTA